MRVWSAVAELLTEVVDRDRFDEVRALAVREAAGPFSTRGRIRGQAVERTVGHGAAPAASIRDCLQAWSLCWCWFWSIPGGLQGIGAAIEAPRRHPRASRYHPDPVDRSRSR